MRIEQDHVGRLRAHDVAHVLQRVRALVERDRHRLRSAQRRVAGEVVELERLLDVRRVERREMAALPFRRARRPRAVHIEAQRRIGPDHFAHEARQLDVRALVVADLQLVRLVAAFAIGARIVGELRRIVLQQVRGERDPRAPLPAPQPEQRLAAGLAERVPHRHLDRAHRHDRRALVVVVAGTENMAMESLGLVDAMADRVRDHGAVQHRRDRVEQADRLAPADEPAAGRDPDDEARDAAAHAGSPDHVGLQRDADEPAVDGCDGEIADDSFLVGGGHD